MRPGPGLAAERVEAFVVRGGQQVAVGLQSEGQGLRLSLGQGEDGLVTVYAREEGDRRCYAKVIIEVGHHHHQGVEPVGLPLEIVPRTHRHVHLGDHYEFTVLKHGRPLAGATVRATYPGSRSAGYPVRVATDESGSARVFLTAPGNWLFSVTDGDVTSTFTLVKGF
ncbi:MAG: DUF4198 domain-containing protein [Syntrophomonadaceae bacterium]|nr:DUF4198 domain-containing protein [Syntrophomonadaceae bacterium]MDH7497967.1 DUF4198 domain-containing protein [Syntrophomonadaceae bacterium]